MINTIFYFTDTQQEYTDNYAQGSVKPHTICFAKDTKTIWRDGQRFSGMLQNEVDDEIHQLTDEAFNNLNDGVQNLETGLNNAVQAAAEEKIRLNGEISRIDGDVATVASNLTATAAAIRNEVRNGELYTSEGWDPKVNAYLKTVGLWDYGTGDTQHVTKWSTLRQSVSDVSSEVNRVEAKADGYNNTLQSKINQEVTDRGEAVTTLSNTFARSTEGLQDVIEWMYSGLHSGASADMSYAEIIAAGKNGASSAISDLRTSIENTADGKYVAESSLTSKVESNLSGIINRVTESSAGTSIFSQIGENTKDIAAVNTFIGEHSAQATLAAQIGEAKSGAIATVKDDLASMHILSKSGNNYTADVYTKAETKGEIKSATTGMATTDDLQRSMGLVYTKTEADRNQLISEAGLITENEFTSASIIAKVNGASSSVKINADHINIDANHQLDLSAQTITVDADDINLNGQTNFENAIGNMITTKSLKISDVNNQINTVIESGNATFSGDVKASTLTAGPEQGMHIVTTGNEIHFMNGSTVMGKFVTEDDGLQMYILGPDGDLYKVNFDNWTNTSGGGTSRTYKLYRFTQSGSSVYYNITNHISVYGNGDDIYYSDQSGKHLANFGSSSATNTYLEEAGWYSSIILPNTQSVPGIENVIYSVTMYRDVYFVNGTKHYGPNQYAITKSDTTDRMYFVKSSTSKSGVYASNVYTSESAGAASCANNTSLNFGSGDVYYATTAISLTPYGSGYMTGIQLGQYNGTLVTY